VNKEGGSHLTTASVMDTDKENFGLRH